MVAIVALIVATIACGLAIALAVLVRRLKLAQRAVLGDGAAGDAVSYVTKFGREIEEFRGHFEATVATIVQRMDQAEVRLDGTLSHRGLVRYDAYGEATGHQSTSIALIDDQGSGVVLSSILCRDLARVYVKQVRDGRGETVELSPEEAKAVQRARGVDSRVAATV